MKVGNTRDARGKLTSFNAYAYATELQKADTWMGILEKQAAAEVFGLTVDVFPQQATLRAGQAVSGPPSVALVRRSWRYSVFPASAGVASAVR